MIMLIFLLFVMNVSFVGLYFYYVNYSKNCFNDGFEEGYRQACYDFNDGKLKMESVDNQNDTKQMEWLDASHKKRRGCIPCEFNKALKGCPRCGSFRIIGSNPRRGVISGYHCLDCKYTWKKK